MVTFESLNAREDKIAVVGLGLLSLWGLLRRAGWGFLGGCFFLVLGPSSSLLPAPDAAFEHRMYLPLAAVLTAIVLAGYRLIQPRLRHARRRLPISGYGGH